MKHRLGGGQLGVNNVCVACAKRSTPDMEYMPTRLEKRSRQDVALTNCVFTRSKYISHVRALYYIFTVILPTASCSIDPADTHFVLLQSLRKQQVCARECDGYRYFGTQFGTEVRLMMVLLLIVAASSKYLDVAGDGRLDVIDGTLA